MRRLLDYPLDWPGASIATVRDLLAMSACHGIVVGLAVLLTLPVWSAS